MAVSKEYHAGVRVVWFEDFGARGRKSLIRDFREYFSAYRAPAQSSAHCGAVGQRLIEREGLRSDLPLRFGRVRIVLPAGKLFSAEETYRDSVGVLANLAILFLIAAARAAESRISQP